MARVQNKQMSPRAARILISCSFLLLAGFGFWIYEARKRQEARLATEPPRLTGLIQDSANLLEWDARMAIEERL